MAKKILIFCQIFIILILFSSRVSAVTEYISNGDFTSNSCQSVTGEHKDCQGPSMVTSWTARKISNKQVVAPISVQDRTSFASFPASTTRIVPLDFLDFTVPSTGRKYVRTCVQQILSQSLPAGTFYLTFQAGTRTNQSATGTQYVNYNYEVGILNPDDTAGALTKQSLSWPYFGFKKIYSVFKTASSLSNQVVSICSRSFVGTDLVTYYDNLYSRATGISMVSLTQIPEVDITAQKQLNVNIVQNGDFMYNDCLDKIDSGYGCQGSTKLLHWSAQLTKDSSAAQISVQNSSNFKNVNDKFVVPLDVYDTSVTSSTPYKRICIKQNLGVLSPGNYKLSFNSATRAPTDLTYISRFQFSTSIGSSDSSTKSLAKTSYTFTAQASVSRTQYFTVVIKKSNQYLYFCSEPISPNVHQTQLTRATGISNVKLINQGCTGTSTVTIPLNTGYFGCASKSVVDGLPNCHIFKYIETTNRTVCSNIVPPATSQCDNTPKLRIGTNKYACPIQNNPTYVDANCDLYKELGNYVYECEECKTGYVNVLPFDDSTKKKCILKINDCIQYNSDGTCYKCYGGQDPLFSGSCPVTSVPLDDGYRADIPNSVYDALKPCQIFKYDSIAKTYSCVNSCQYLPKMKLTTANDYACPTMDDPLYADPNCLKYKDLTNYDYNCFSCVAPYLRVRPFGQNKHKCLTEIIDCQTYYPSGDCKVCKSGDSPITTDNPDSCPLVLKPMVDGTSKLIPKSVVMSLNCQIYKEVSGVYSCDTNCQHESMMILTTPNQYACPDQDSPLYWDNSCATYSKVPLSNYDYQCESCTGSKIVKVPADGTKNKCFTKIDDCTSYYQSGDCSACINGGTVVTSTSPDSCPTTTVYLDTGLTASIPNSVVADNSNCWIFTFDTANQVYDCYTQCSNGPQIMLVSNTPRCATSTSAPYLDLLCDKYDDLGNSNYNCSSCLYSKIAVQPFSATYSKCLDFIPDCQLYDSFGNCLQCKSGQPPVTATNPHQCPATLKPMKDGQDVYVPNSYVKTNPNCDIFQQSAGVFTCASSCTYETKMTLTSGGFGCPTENDPVYWDNNCATYSKISVGDYNCETCTGSLIAVKPSNWPKNKCVTILDDCIQYDSLGNCVSCQSGQLPITSTNPDTCPSTLKPMDTGLSEEIPNSVLQAQRSCHIFTKNALTGVYSCASTCNIKTEMTLTTGGYACPLETNNYPDYWDDNCYIYEKLYNYDYECHSCLGSLIAVRPFQGPKNRCLNQIPDCISYHAQDYCLLCHGDANPISGFLCPYTIKPLNTGVFANIPNSFVDANPTCKIFRLKLSSTNKYECASGCINNQMMLLNTGSYVCPDEYNAPYYDSQCATYIQKGSNTFECSSCGLSFSLKNVSISNKNYTRCLKTLVTDCTVYLSDGVCTKCLNGTSFNNYFNLCPSQAYKLVNNCQAAIFGSTIVACIACKTNFIVGPSNQCLAQVQYCQLYADTGKKQCKKCVSGFYLYNNICYKVQGNCEMFDPKKNTCNKCLAGYTLKNNDCVEPPKECLENQYRNSYGICVNGDTPNCGFYDSATGICQNCKEGYKFNQYWNCVQIITVICPPDTADYSYMIELGQCRKVQKSCAYSGSDGCLACKSGYYLYNKQCLKVSAYQGLTTQTQTTQTFREQDYWF